MTPLFRAKLWNRGGGWYSWRKVTRSDVIERAIKAWLDGAATKGGAS